MQTVQPKRILRSPVVIDRYGRARATMYGDVKDGLFVPPVRMGPACSGWPEHEVEAVINARIAGKSADEIKALVRELVAARNAPPSVTG